MSAVEIIAELAPLATADLNGYDLANALRKRLAKEPDDVFWRVLVEFWPNIAFNTGMRAEWLPELRRRQPFAEHLPSQSWLYFDRLPQHGVGYQFFRRDRGFKNMCHTTRLNAVIPDNQDLSSALAASGYDAVSVVRFAKTDVLLACDENRARFYPVGCVVLDLGKIDRVGEADTLGKLLDLAIEAERGGKPPRQRLARRRGTPSPDRRHHRGGQPAPVPPGPLSSSV